MFSWCREKYFLYLALLTADLNKNSDNNFSKEEDISLLAQFSRGRKR